MKCPKCSADSTVDETRAYMLVFTRRTRRCSNQHRFETFEVYVGNLDKRTLASKEQGVRQRRASDARRRHVLARPDVPASELAKQLLITEARVRQIRAEGRA